MDTFFLYIMVWNQADFFVILASKNRKSTAETLDGSMSRDKKKRSALDLSGKWKGGS